MQVCKCICFIIGSNITPLVSDIIVRYHTPKETTIIVIISDAHSLSLSILAWT